MIPKIDHFEAVRGPADRPGTSPDDSIRQVTIDGKSFYAFTLRPGDVQSWDSKNIGPNGQPNERAEISYAPALGTDKVKSPYNVTDKTGVQTYDIDYRFPSGFPPHTAGAHQWGMVGLQCHVQDDNPSRFNGITGVSFHDGQITLARPDGSYFAKEPITPDVTIQRRLVVNWNSTEDGYAWWIDRATGHILGNYSGPTIAAGEFKYLKQGYYRAGGLPEATVYCTPVDINAGELPAVKSTPVIVPAPVTPPAVVAAGKRNSKPFDAKGNSVQPNDGADLLIATRNDLVSIRSLFLASSPSALKLTVRIDAINKLLNLGPWTPQ